MIKHQSKCYRNINGVKYMNFADLIYGDEENAKTIEEAKSQYKHVKIINHWTKEYKQLFVSIKN